MALTNKDKLRFIHSAITKYNLFRQVNNSFLINPISFSAYQAPSLDHMGMPYKANDIYIMNFYQDLDIPQNVHKLIPMHDGKLLALNDKYNIFDLTPSSEKGCFKTSDQYLDLKDSSSLTISPKIGGYFMNRIVQVVPPEDNKGQIYIMNPTSPTLSDRVLVSLNEFYRVHFEITEGHIDIYIKDAATISLDDVGYAYIYMSNYLVTNYHRWSLYYSKKIGGVYKDGYRVDFSASSALHTWYVRYTEIV